MFEKLLCKIAQALDQDGISYMLIGGQAVLLYGSPRLTRDIDITLGIDVNRLNDIQTVCSRLNLKILPKDPAAFAQETRVLPVEDLETNIRVDFIFSYSPYEDEALRRVRVVDMAGQPVKFASPEDLIIHKLLAGRAVDLEDVKNVLIKNHSTLDFAYIETWLAEFQKLDEGQGLLKSFAIIQNETRPLGGDSRG